MRVTSYSSCFIKRRWLVGHGHGCVQGVLARSKEKLIFGL